MFQKEPAYILCDLKQEASRENVMVLSVNNGFEMEGGQYSNASRELRCSGAAVLWGQCPPMPIH